MPEPTNPNHAANPPPAGAPAASEPVWTFRGYQMRPSEFNTAMVHYYRAEVQRANAWRTRLDTTTNWAVVTTGAGISFALSSPTNHFAVIILNTILVTIFLWMESRRYRYYELWSHRSRLMETEFFAPMLVPPFGPSAEWAESLAASLLRPEFPISMWEAVGRRLRRNYMWIFFVLGIAWTLKTYLHPSPAADFAEFLQRSALGAIPGWVVLTIGLVYNGLLFGIGIFTTGLQQAEGEVIAHWGNDVPILNKVWDAMEVHGEWDIPQQAAPPTTGPTKSPFAWVGKHKRQQLLALIISSKAQAIADRVLKEMGRGVTGLEGRGMYTQQASQVLLIAATVTEMPQLKALVKLEDKDAFLIVTPAQEISGRGFAAL